MHSTISAHQDLPAHFPALPIAPLDETERAAAQLRTLLMGLAPAAGPYRWHGPRYSVSTLGLVDVRRVAPSVQVLPAPRWSAPAERFWVRPEIADRLGEAAQSLAPGYSLGYWEGFRPLSIQNTLWQTGLELVGAMHPKLDSTQLEDTVETFIARPNAQAPHTQGRAVDVALLDATGRVLDDKANLDVLSNALSTAGLDNYAPEWWHWSYGAGDA